MKIICLLLSIMLLSSCSSDTRSALPKDEMSAKRLLYQYESSIQCKGCHADQYLQYEDSMHSKAFSNPLFNAQYFNEVVPRAQRDPNLVQEARSCIACHAPTVFMNYTGLVSTPAEAGRFETGITCDFCHTFGGYGENGDYLQVKSQKKQGPFEERGSVSHHSEYSGYLQVSEYCGGCHNATNHIGLEVKSTLYEWRESSYGKNGVTCQECHMNKNGFLLKGVAEFEQGQAAYMNIGTTEQKQKDHSKLYNHSFPGAHNQNQLTEAVPLTFKIGTRTADSDGRFPFILIVDNQRSGHKMPSGSSDLRFLWIVVTATTADGRSFPVYIKRTVSGKSRDYSVAGASPDDGSILQNDVPAGSRLYRTVMVNAAGRQSLYQYDAVKVAFDNRLDAAEVRKERYYIKVPTDFSGKVTLEAKLYYRGAPSSFARRLQIPDFSPVLISSQKKNISVEHYHAFSN